MVRANCITYLLIILGAPTDTQAARIRHKGSKIDTRGRETQAVPPDVTYAPPLCDSGIVKEVCSDMISNGDTVKQEFLEERLSATAEAVDRLWSELNLADEPSCSDVCHGLVDYISKVGVLPPASDMACYTIDSEVRCDRYVGPEVLSEFGPSDPEDLPAALSLLEDSSEVLESRIPTTENASDMGGEAFLETGSLLPDNDDEGIDFPTWELAKHAAMLFRIFPGDKPSESSSLAELGKTSVWPSQGRERTVLAQQDSKAYLMHTIAAFNKKATKKQMTRWFGSSAFSDPSSRKQVLKVLNSVVDMISNVHFVPKGKECSSLTYAYVYPKAMMRCPYKTLRRNPCTKTDDGKYVMYLCPYYFKKPSEMVETLVHEGSHHAKAYLDDVAFSGQTAYGRPLCKRLATVRPRGALKNADNFCYYVQDTADQVTVSPGSDTKVPVVIRPDPPNLTLPDDNINSNNDDDSEDEDNEAGDPICIRSGPQGDQVKSQKPDRDGNCHCKYGGLTCYDGQEKGCKTAVKHKGDYVFFTKTNRYHHSCFTCGCKYGPPR